MTDKRANKIYNEGLRRGRLWLEHSTFDEMTGLKSKLRFEMSLGLFGYVLEKPQWMKKEKFNKFVTEEEFFNTDYDKIIDTLYIQLRQENSNKKPQNQ